MKKRAVRKSASVVRGNANVFADLGFGAESPELEVKAELTRQLGNRIKAMSLTQARAAVQLGIGQPDVSKLINGRFTGYSVERLLTLLNALQLDVDIVIRPQESAKAHRHGVLRVLESIAV